MRIILLLKTKPKFKFILAKIIYPRKPQALYLEDNFYYFHNKYLDENLNFILENRFSLLLFVVKLIGLTKFYLFVQKYKVQTIKMLCKIKEQLVEVKDNCVLESKYTLNKYINYFDMAV